MGEPVIAMYFVFYAVNGFFQHSNIELRYGLLNYVISGAELHRWHHSRTIDEANTNFGQTVSVWDWVFGTYYWPERKLGGRVVEPIGQIGIEDSDYPVDPWRQLIKPFQSQD